LEEFGNGKGKLANASEEGQGPRRAVEPMMMMKGRFCSCHREHSVSHQLLTAEPAKVKYPWGG
jgi:hypothetical protein